MWETWVWSLGWEDPLEKGMATHSSILAWRIPWTIQSMGSQRIRYDWATFTSLTEKKFVASGRRYECNFVFCFLFFNGKGTCSFCRWYAPSPWGHWGRGEGYDEPWCGAMGPWEGSFGARWKRSFSLRRTTGPGWRRVRGDRADVWVASWALPQKGERSFPRKETGNQLPPGEALIPSKTGGGALDQGQWQPHAPGGASVTPGAFVKLLSVTCYLDTCWTGPGEGVLGSPGSLGGMGRKSWGLPSRSLGSSGGTQARPRGFKGTRKGPEEQHLSHHQGRTRGPSSMTD